VEDFFHVTLFLVDGANVKSSIDEGLRGPLLFCAATFDFNEEGVAVVVREHVALALIGDDLSVVDDDDGVADGGNLLHDVGGEDDGLALAHVTNELSDFDNLVGVQSRGGLVKDEHLRVVDDGLCQSHTLAVALAELGDAFGAFRREPDLLNDFVNSLYDVGKSVEPGDVLQVFADVHFEVEGVVFRKVANQSLRLDGMLSNVYAAHAYAAAVKGDVAGDALHGSAFARSVGTDESNDLATVNG